MTLDTRHSKALLEKLDALGLGDQFPAEARTLLARADQLTDAAQSQEDDRYGAVRRQVVADLAAGTMTPVKARDALVDAHTRSDVGNLTRQALVDAAAAAGRQAGAVLVARGEALISEVFAPEGRRLVDQVTRATADIPDTVTSGDEAILAGPKVSKAWGRMVEANDRWTRLVALVKALRSDRILAGNPNDDFLYYRKPDPTGGRISLTDALARGMEPRLATEAEAAAEYEEHRQRLAAERAAAETPRRNRGSSFTPPPLVTTQEQIDALVESVRKENADA